MVVQGDWLQSWEEGVGTTVCPKRTLVRKHMHYSVPATAYMKISWYLYLLPY
jgi:hypothetical protein